MIFLTKVNINLDFGFESPLSLVGPDTPHLFRIQREQRRARKSLGFHLSSAVAGTPLYPITPWLRPGPRHHPLGANVLSPARKVQAGSLEATPRFCEATLSDGMTRKRRWFAESGSHQYSSIARNCRVSAAMLFGTSAPPATFARSEFYHTRSANRLDRWQVLDKGRGWFVTVKLHATE
jgi:hypothetical protein